MATGAVKYSRRLVHRSIGAFYAARSVLNLTLYALHALVLVYTVVIYSIQKYE